MAVNVLKIIAYQILWKSVPWKPSCSVRTETDKDNSRFSQFCKRAYQL